MEKIFLQDVPVTGLPLYEMQEFFAAQGDFCQLKISYITLLPGRRVPTCGSGAHKEDDYAFFLEGEAYTESGSYKGICRQGEATFIPHDEEHWSENRTDQPCRLVCVLVETASRQP